MFKCAFSLIAYMKKVNFEKWILGKNFLPFDNKPRKIDSNHDISKKIIMKPPDSHDIFVSFHLANCSFYVNLHSYNHSKVLHKLRYEL